MRIGPVLVGLLPGLLWAPQSAAARSARPYGIKLNSKNEPWVVEFGSNKLMRVNRDKLTVEEIELPKPASRPRRMSITSNDNVWYVDYALGRLGRYAPEDETFTEWDMPSGGAARPYGMAVDRNDRLWFVETGG